MTTRRSFLMRGWMAAATIVAASLALATPSAAGVYHFYSCRIPYGPQAGEPAPVQVAAGEGEEAGRWSHEVSGMAQFADLCGSGGALAASLQAGMTHANTDLSTWQFNAPSAEKITAAKLWLAGNADGGSGYLFWLASPANPSPANAVSSEDFISGCVYTLGCRGIGNTAEPLAAANKVQVPAANLGGSHLYINASCSSASCPSSGGDEQGHAVVVYVYAADIALEQQSAPVVSGVSGELVTAASLSGAASLDFHAEDSGSGVYLAKVSVDGAPLESQVVDPTELCKEVSVPAEDEPAFLSAQPCPASANGHVSLDTTKLADGSHRLLVEVTDAAGNATTVLERTIEVANGVASGPLSGGGSTASILQTGATAGSLPPKPNGVPASADAKIAARWVVRPRGRRGAPRLRLTGRFGDPQTIAGRLTGRAGEAIADAEIAVSARKRYGGASTVALSDVRTDRQGRFTVHLNRGSSSEQLTLTYSPTLGGAPVASKRLSLVVPAGVLLHVTPSSVAVGQTIELAGRVLGGPIPSGGKQVVLEARSIHTPWLQFLVLRTNRRGRFRGSHRFRLPGPVRYWFRAVCLQEADFPYAAGSSKAVSVWER